MSKIKYIKKAILFLWHEYKFLVPPSMIMMYFRRAKFKFRYGDMSKCFYNPNDENEYNKWIKERESFSNVIVETDFEICVYIHSNNNFLNIGRCMSSLGKQTNKRFKIIENLSDAGEHVLLIDSDDIVSKHLINELLINFDSSVDMMYFDDDIINGSRRSTPHFKPSFLRENLLCRNYIGTSFLIRKGLISNIDINPYTIYSLLFKLMESKAKVCHVSGILLHKQERIFDSKHVEIVEGFLTENNCEASVEKRNDFSDVKFKHKEEMVSIIIPTRDLAQTLEVCLLSIFQKTLYTNYEVIVVDNGSVEESTFKLFERFSKYENFKVIRLECEFNYSYLNNYAAKHSSGEYIVLLNNDTEIIEHNWISNMLGYARLDHVGAVGAKLLFPDNTIQHYGVIIGLFGVAGHPYWNLASDSTNDCTHNVSAVTGACLMVKKTKMFEIGGLNEEELKVAFNDVDFCIRLTQKGYNNVLVPSALLYHHESKSRGLDTTAEKFKRSNVEIQYMFSQYNGIMLDDVCYNNKLSLMKPYYLDKYDRIKIRKQNIGTFYTKER